MYQATIFLLGGDIKVMDLVLGDMNLFLYPDMNPISSLMILIDDDIYIPRSGREASAT